MKTSEIIKKIEQYFPLNSAMSFDNSGANVVDSYAEVTGIVVCLDVTLQVIEYAKSKNVNLIISHHPLIFNEIQNLNDTPIARRIKLLNKYEISAYSVHTNFDVNLSYGMGKSLLNVLFDNSVIKEHSLLEKYLIDDTQYGIGDITTFNKKFTFDEILTIIISKLGLSIDKVSCYNLNMDINKLIIIPGSGSSDVDLVINEKPDLLITSDLQHNQIVDLIEAGISYINATHYGLEKIFVKSFEKFLIEKLQYNNVLTVYNQYL